jgi:hypothetical protein
MSILDRQVGQADQNKQQDPAPGTKKKPQNRC